MLYFYPKDSTPGCTKQACAFAAAHGEYEALGVPVVGVSKDSQKSHQRFAEKNGLPFLLLSDPELTAIQAYDVWKEKKLYGKTSMGVVRTTYVIGPDGCDRVGRGKGQARPERTADFGLFNRKISVQPLRNAVRMG